MAALAIGGGAWPVLDPQGNVKLGRDGRVILVQAENTRAIKAGVVAYRVIFARAERGLGLDLFLSMQRDDALR